MFVYVVTAIVDGKVEEQLVFDSPGQADCVYDRFCEIYGGATVCKASREVIKQINLKEIML